MAALVQVIEGLFKVTKFVILKIVIPLTKLMVFFMGFVLVITFIANIAGIIGFLIFMVMFYYYVKGIIFIEPNK
jgi:hypothetical protein